MKFFQSLSICIFLSILPTNIASAEPNEINLPANCPAQRTVDLNEVWRIGGLDDEDTLLGVVIGGIMDETGNTYLLDFQLAQILVINPEGEQIGTLSRQGEGPGELNQPSSLFWYHQKQVGVTQGFPGKLVLLNLDDTPGGTIELKINPESGGFVYAGKAASRNGHLVVGFGVGSFDMNTGKMVSTNLLSEIDEQGQEATRFVEKVQTRDLQKQIFDEEADYSEMTTWALGDEFVYTVPFRNQYLIYAKDRQGNISQIIKRPFEARKRNDQDKDDLTSGFNMVAEGQKIEIEKHILDSDAALASLNVATNGRLFIQNCYQAQKLLPTGIARRFDIVDAKGQLLEELSLALPDFNNQKDQLAFIDGTYFLWLRNIEDATKTMMSNLMGSNSEEPKEEEEEAEPLEIVLCRIPEAN